MPVPTLITELSTTAGNNSPSGGDTPGDGDNHIRALAAFIASILANSGNGWTSPYAVAADLAAYLPKAGGTMTGVLIALKAYTATSSQAFTVAPTFNCNLGNAFEFTGAMTSNVTSCAITNGSAGQTISIRVIQDGTGGRTFANPSGSKVAGAVGATASAASILTLTYSASGVRWEGAWLNLPA
jgi:hypothetical protein